MKKITVAIAFIACMSCKKEKEFCWVCADNSGVSPNKTACGLTENEIKRWEQEKDDTCTRQ